MIVCFHHYTIFDGILRSFNKLNRTRLIFRRCNQAIVRWTRLFGGGCFGGLGLLIRRHSEP